MSSGATSKSRYFRQGPRKWFLRVLAMLLVCLGLFHLISTIASPNDSSLFKRGIGKQGQSALEVKRGEWCTEKEYVDGEWLKRDEEVTLQRLREIFKYTDGGVFACLARDSPRGSMPPQGDPEHYARILETAKYEWKPKSGCRKHEWDGWNFAKYCLRARAGCSLVGDSLADQIYRAVHYTLVNPRNSLFMINGSPERIFNISVNRGHRDAVRLAKEAGVSLERFQRPVFNYWREHHLIHRHELDHVFKGLWHYVPWVGRATFAENGWIHDRSWWYEKWTELLAQPIRLEPRVDGTTPKEEASMISFNSAPHWTTTELWPEHTRRHVRNEDLLRGWVGAFTIVMQKVAQVAKEHDVIAWWRSTVPGHVECAQYTAPENNRTHHFSTLNPNATGFNWHLYPIMDRYASTRLGYKPFDSNQYLGTTRDALRYLDLWSMSVKRPDAHLNPQFDCSHFCVPGPPHEWLQFMWHLMLIEAKNNDYDLPNGKWWVSNIEL